MAKKEEKKEVEFVAEVVKDEREKPPVEESEPELKPIGQGGAVPVYAPKNTTIQLQPIIVPLAVVPYMSQDSSVLRTDGEDKPKEEDEAPDFVEVKKAKKAFKAYDRTFSLVSLILSTVLFLPFVISYFKGTLVSVIFEEFNVIGAISLWVKDGFSASPYTNIVYLASALVFAVLMIATLIGLVSGKYPKAFGGVLSLFGAGTLVGVIVTEAIKKDFVLDDRIALVAFGAVAAFNFLLFIVFSTILNKREDRLEDLRFGAEI